jgi:aminoglycoside phosphotransferase (APT) family kinase protein
MALLTNRDPLVVANALAGWLTEHRGIAGARVVEARHPSIGYSSETVMVDLAWEGGGGEFVVRLAPPTEGTFRDYDLAEQVAAQLAAAQAGVAIATPELVTDPRWLDAPFVVMPRVDGHIVGEVAAFDAWLLSLTVGERAEVHESFVSAIAATHRAEPPAGVPARDNLAELAFWADYLNWSSGNAPLPGLVAALRWCHANQPATESAPVLLWGDVRLGNVIFGDDRRPRAVLDWDMATIGAREHDVAWFVMLETTMRAMLGSTLDGFPERDGTIAQYERLSGHTVHDFEWYETFALLRSTAIMTRIGYLYEAAGQRPPLPIADNPLLDLLEARIA